MKNTIILYKGYDPGLYGGWFWSLEEVRDACDCIYSDPYLVELPSGFYLGETVESVPMIFKADCGIGYSIIAGCNAENCLPHLIGGAPVENIALRVVGPITDNK